MTDTQLAATEILADEVVTIMHAADEAWRRMGGNEPGDDGSPAAFTYLDVLNVTATVASFTYRDPARPS